MDTIPCGCKNILSLILISPPFSFKVITRKFSAGSVCLSLYFLLNKVFVAVTKRTAERNKTGFISYSPDYPPLNSCNKASF